MRQAISNALYEEQDSVAACSIACLLSLTKEEVVSIVHTIIIATNPKTKKRNLKHMYRKEVKSQQQGRWHHPAGVGAAAKLLLLLLGSECSSSYYMVRSIAAWSVLYCI